MSGSSHWSYNDNSYRHGIVCRYCIVKKYNLESAVSTVHVGTLVEILNVQDENVVFRIIKSDMQAVDDLFLCKRGDVLFVPENLWGPLLTVEEQARLSIVQDSELAEVLGNITVGDTVKILGPDFKETCIGSVKFKNSIAKLGLGVYFGLNITYSIKDTQYIKENCSLLQPGTKGFPRGCDIVVSIDKIRPIDVRTENKNITIKEDGEWVVGSSTIKTDNNLGYKHKPVLELDDKINRKTCHHERKSSHSNTSELNQGKKKVYDIPLSVGEQVVCIDKSNFEKGTVRWIGLIKNELRIGIEFENPVGSGTGTVDGVELFKSKYLHAALMPPESLIKLSDFEMNTSKDYSNQSNQQKTTNNNNNYNNLRSNGQCCSWSQNHDDRNKMLKINSFQNSKYVSSSHCGDYLHLKNCNENINSRDVECGETCKTECSICISQIHYPSRSFELVKSSTNEKKIGNNRQSKSMDNDISQNKELLVNLQNSFVSMQKSANKDLDDFFAHKWPESCELHHEAPDLNSAFNTDHCDFPHYIKKKNIQNSDVHVWETQNSEQSSSDESGDYYDTLKPSTDNVPSQKLGKGSVVELIYKGQPYYGVIRWMGTIPDEGEVNPPRIIAGIEMEEEGNNFTDGTFRNKRYFHCNPRKALFVPLSECRKDSRFIEQSNKQSNYQKINSFGQVDCPVVEGIIPPISFTGDLEAICGKNRGIQGHHNSCYLDATLFAMFAFTSVFDSLLYRPPTVTDIPQYSEVQRVLKEEIVNPLRKNLYVRADRVMKLRTLLENLSSVSGLTCEEKDPEEFLNSLLAQILRAEPFLKLSSGQETFHYQLFVEKDERLVFPSVQQLFEQSFVTSDIKLKQIPSCLIIQMPRFGKSYKMYSRIFPPQLLDVTDIIENSPRQCTVCGKLAEYECKDCFGQNGIGSGLESISYCKICLEKAHSHHYRTRHNYRSITVPFEFFDLQEHCTIPRINMELYAVVCIETSHYVAFVKCGTGSDAPWCFFDSMADRKGEQNGYNIPEMVACPDLPYWLSEEGMKTLNGMKDERQLPEHAKRLLCDAYMCMYQSPDIMMYR